MQFRTLEKTSVAAITETFNRAFSDYLLPLHLSESQLQENIIRDDVDLQYSAGAFNHDKLTGIILKALGTWNNLKTAYNAGTGVVPAHRGKHLAQKIYAYILPQLQAAGAEQCLLEVITSNEPALKTYETLGFNISRIFDCYRGAVKPLVKPIANNFKLKEVLSLDWPTAQQFWNIAPSWQHSVAGAERNKINNRQIGIFAENKLVGYGIVHPKRGRIIQFAIAESYRGKGLGHRLFGEMARLSQEPLSIFNVDQANPGIKDFLKSIGFIRTISQFEMIKLL